MIDWLYPGYSCGGGRGSRLKQYECLKKCISVLVCLISHGFLRQKFRDALYAFASYWHLESCHLSFYYSSCLLHTAFLTSCTALSIFFEFGIVELLPHHKYALFWIKQSYKSGSTEWRVSRQTRHRCKAAGCLHTCLSKVSGLLGMLPRKVLSARCVFRGELRDMKRRASSFLRRG